MALEIPVVSKSVAPSICPLSLAQSGESQSASCCKTKNKNIGEPWNPAQLTKATIMITRWQRANKREPHHLVLHVANSG